MYNLTCRKDQDFYITSSEVEMEKLSNCGGPKLEGDEILSWMLMLAGSYAKKGYNITLTQESV